MDYIIIILPFALVIASLNYVMLLVDIVGEMDPVADIKNHHIH